MIFILINVIIEVYKSNSDLRYRDKRDYSLISVNFMGKK